MGNLWKALVIHPVFGAKPPSQSGRTTPKSTIDVENPPWLSRLFHEKTWKCSTPMLVIGISLGHHGDFIGIYLFVCLKPEIIVRSIRCLGKVPLLRLICLGISGGVPLIFARNNNIFFWFFSRDPVQWTSFSNWKQTIFGLKPQIIWRQWPTSCTFTSQLTLWTVYRGSHPMCTGQVALSKTIVDFLRGLGFWILANHAKMTEANDALNSGEWWFMWAAATCLIGALDPWSPHLVNG